MMKKAIAMKCSQKDWDSIKDRLEGKYEYIDSFDEYKYLTNIFTGEKNCVSNISKKDKFGIGLCEEIHETFNAKIFLNACGIDCDVYEITKEQVLEMASWGNLRDIEKVKEWFPDAFKKELVVGRWYKVNTDNHEYLLLYSGTSLSLGFCYKEWGNWAFTKGSNQEFAIEATPQEVETALINEAKKKYTIGSLFKSLNVCSLNEQCEINNYIFSFGGNFRLYTSLEDCIFSDGVWSEIIETITIQEAEKLLSCKII